MVGVLLKLWLHEVSTNGAPGFSSNYSAFLIALVPLGECESDWFTRRIGVVGYPFECLLVVELVQLFVMSDLP